MLDNLAAPQKSAVPMVFERHEQKYVMDRSTYQQLLKNLGDQIRMDQYGKQTISSLYYDTEDYMFARRQLDNSKYREKLRLRAYGDPVDHHQPAFVELKKKVNGITYKRRVTLPYNQAHRYLASRSGSISRNDDMNAREIDRFTHSHELSRQTAVIYERTAYSTADGLRLTFDENIRWRSRNVNLINHNQGIPLLASGMVVMEIKLPRALPFEWSQLFASLKLYPQPFSKYGLIYKYGIQGGQQCLSVI